MQVIVVQEPLFIMVMMVALELFLHLEIAILFFCLHNQFFETLLDFKFIFARNYTFAFGGKLVRHIHPILLSLKALFLVLVYQLSGKITWSRLYQLYLMNFQTIDYTFLNFRTLQHVVPLILSSL